VPEIYTVWWKSAPSPASRGERAKWAVSATQPGIDPVGGACVGIKGVRIQAIVKELSNEKMT
jgi:N utilization substance protein A